MTGESPQNEILLDRLVDGELSETEQRRLLEQLDARPDGWRRCALAFLESQSWREELGHLARETRAPAGASPTEPVATARSTPNTMHRRAAWLAIAASLLVGFILGSMRGDPEQAGLPFATPDAPHGEPLVAESPRPQEVAPQALRKDDALTMWVLDDRGQTRPVQVPLLDAGLLEQQLGVEFQPALPEDIRQQLNQRGYLVESKRRYAPLWLEDGRQMIVPVEDTRIVPVQNVY